MNILRMCLNWRVAAGLGALGAALFLIAPEIGLAALPFLLVAVCPLSMMFMMNSMGPAQPPVPSTSGGESGPERVAALRGELAELRRRQDRLAAELAAEGDRARTDGPASDAVASQRAR